MKRIYKFPIAAELDQHVVMPAGARILTVGVQNGDVVLWAECDDDHAWLGRQIIVTMTGGTPPDNAVYVGTFQLDSPGGRFVGHVYDPQVELTVEARLGAAAA